jgi:hypothetical protein
MSLGSLPVEILEQIVDETLPEGFESFALTCRDFHAICKPFIQQHKELRTQWDDFYYPKFIDIGGGSMHDAFRVLEAMAAEPKIVRYIRHADFTGDPWSRYTRPPEESFWEPGADGPYRPEIYSLLTSSSYLRIAELDPCEYYRQMFNDLKSGRPRRPMPFSQHAFTFLLTLLPNLQTIKLPGMWAPTEETTILLSMIANHADSSLGSKADMSLARLTKIKLMHVSGGPRLLKHVRPFTALPSLDTFEMHYGLATPSNYGDFPPKQFRLHNSSALVDLRLYSCNIDPMSLSDFLMGAPCLKCLKYSHTYFEAAPRVWDISKTIAVIASRTARSLERLSLSTSNFYGMILPGQPSFRDFTRLTRLTFPPELIQNIPEHSELAQEYLGGNELVTGPGDIASLRIGALLPRSLCRLKLVSNTMNEHFSTLEVVLKDFASQKMVDLPNIRLLKIQGNVRDVKKEDLRKSCWEIFSDCKDIGVAFVALDQTL